MRNNKSYKGKKKSSTNIESLDSMDFEDEGFIEGDFDFGRPVAAFSFGDKKDIDVKEAPVENQNIFNKPSKRNSSKDPVVTSYPKGITPPINGEQYTVQRCHQYRPSTLRKLNELKAKHPDVNVYLNTIIDEAIVHYYNYIFNDGGDFNDSFQ